MMMPPPCSDFPCYDSLYLQQSSSTVKTDENGVARWDMLSTEPGKRIVYAKIGDVKIDNNDNPPVITYYDDNENSDILKLNIIFDGRDLDTTTDTADYAYPIKISIIKEKKIIDTLTVSSTSEGKFPDPKDPNTEMLTEHLKALSPDEYTFRVYSNIHLPINIVGKFDPAKNYSLDLNLLAGNIEQQDISNGVIPSDVETINGADISAFFPLWGKNVTISCTGNPDGSPICDVDKDDVFVADINGNGQVGAEDFSVLLKNLLKEETTIEFDEIKLIPNPNDISAVD